MTQPIRTTEQLGLILQGYRKSRSLTQGEAAKRVGLLPKTISKLELSPDNSSIISLFKLISALDLELVLQPKDTSRSNQGEW